MSSLKNKFQWTQKNFWPLIRKILIWTFWDYKSSWSKKSTPIQPRGVIGAPLLCISKDAILGSVPSISLEVLGQGHEKIVNWRRQHKNNSSSYQKVWPPDKMQNFFFWIVQLASGKCISYPILADNATLLLRKKAKKQVLCL